MVGHALVTNNARVVTDGRVRIVPNLCAPLRARPHDPCALPPTRAHASRDTQTTPHAQHHSVFKNANTGGIALLQMFVLVNPVGLTVTVQHQFANKLVGTGGIVRHQTHVHVQLIGSARTAGPQCVDRHAKMVVNALHPTPVHVHQNGLVTIAPYPCVRKGIWCQIRQIFTGRQRLSCPGALIVSPDQSRIFLTKVADLHGPSIRHVTTRNKILLGNHGVISHRGLIVLNFAMLTPKLPCGGENGAQLPVLMPQTVLSCQIRAIVCALSSQLVCGPLFHMKKKPVTMT
mmetsp:Transcript_34542/g.55149  ORF Transcript_34542/g.55149 Transcript_34542/m.55149 type:complete len:288 (+) Transcript_34542:2501-3364(+)